jgi:hypothetical protein
MTGYSRAACREPAIGAMPPQRENQDRPERFRSCHAPSPATFLADRSAVDRGDRATIVRFYVKYSGSSNAARGIPG